MTSNCSAVSSGNRSIWQTLTVRFTASMAVIGCLMLSGCEARKDAGSGKQTGTAFVDIGTSPAGGVFNPVGTALAEALNEHKGENDWKAQAKGTKGSRENIRLLSKGDLQLAISNSAISHFAYEGTSGWEEKHDIRAVATLSPNVASFLTTKDSGIKTIADLKGKKVVVGPPGAGFEMFVEPILKAHGMSMSDFEVANAGQSATVDMLKDGQADAAFLGGGVPHPAIDRLCNETDAFFIPWDADALKKCAEQFDFFWAVPVAKAKYDKTLEADFAGMNVGSMHVITSADQSEDVIYNITKTLWENRATIGHPIPKKTLNEKNAARFTGTPFHPGAIKFYKEIGIWKD